MASEVEQFAGIAAKIQRGNDIVTGGHLRNLRNRIGYSKTHMAELIGCSALTYGRWEQGPVTHSLWPKHAVAVAKLADQIVLILAELEAEGVVLRDYVPLHVAAANLGLPQEVFLGRIRSRDVETLDLGILGLWVPKSR